MPNQFSNPKRPPVYVIGPSIAYISLSRGLFALVDWEDAAFLAQWNWSAKRSSSAEYYAFRNVRDQGSHKVTYMHRVLMGEDDRTIDHANCNPLDNRRVNLRWATTAQNVMNGRMRSTNTTGFKGISKRPTGARWEAKIMVAGKSIYLGNFSTPESAQEAYAEAAQRLHGKFSRTR